MMRIMIMFCSMIVLFSCSWNSTSKEHSRPNTDVGKYKLNGNVKSVEEVCYDIDKISGEKTQITLKFTQKFDLKGKIVEVTTFAAFDSSNSTRNSYSYDSFGKVIQDNRYDFHNRLISTSVMQYDKSGNLIETDIFKNGVLGVKTVNVNDSGRKISIDNVFDKNGVASERTMRIFNDSEDEVEERIFMQGKLSEIITRSFDKQHNELENNMHHLENGSHSVWKDTYDDKGCLVERTSSLNGRRLFKSVFKYDSFDKANNWRIKTESLDGDPSAITERKIEYW